MFFGLFVVLLYVATERVSWVLIGVLLFAGGCVLSYEFFGTVKQRVTVWLHVFDYLQDEGYQMSQSLFGLGTGGLFGAGLGGGRPELVPVAKSDFILSAFGEELGLFGLVAILGVYLVILSRGLRHRARGPGLLRQAAGHRTDLLAGPAAVRGGRRHLPAAARDRPHHPVPVLRRLVAGGQLRAAGAAAAGLRRGPAAAHHAAVGGHHRQRPGAGPRSGAPREPADPAGRGVRRAAAAGGGAEPELGAGGQGRPLPGQQRQPADRTG